jgi:methylmalonyl-CoA mutase N-terminal domain/subunit
VIAHESGVANTVDPLAGSYFVESLTDALETRAEELIDTITEMGGAVAAIEEGWMQAQIEDSAYQEAKRQGSGESVVVGVNRFAVDDSEPVPVHEVDPTLEAMQRQAVASWRENRDQSVVDATLDDVVSAAASDVNLMPPIKYALATGATVGEVSDALRGVFGLHRPTG